MDISRHFVIGDIHGGYKSLMQCLERSKFDYDKDELIVLGDVCDGWPETKECFDELLKIKHLVFILGNHDWWALQWMTGKEKLSNMMMWTTQGGDQTIKSYTNESPPYEMSPLPDTVPPTHIHLLLDVAKDYYIDKKNRLFVHGGFDPKIPIVAQSKQDLLWDRMLIQKAHDTRRTKLTNFNEIFIGHTTTTHFGEKGKPVKYCEIWDLDSGGGWEGKLTIMNIDTHEYWQSDWVHTLYPETDHAKAITKGV